MKRGYLAAAGALTKVVEDYAEGTDDSRRAEQARFASNILISTLSPTNYLPTNPAALKRAFDTGGRSLARGLGHFVDDLRNNGGMPRMVDPDAFEVGRNLALSPGAVVARDEICEVLQFAPSTPEVHRRPLVVIPPRSTSTTSWISHRGAASSNTQSPAKFPLLPSAGATRPRGRPIGPWTTTRRAVEDAIDSFARSQKR